MKRDTRIFTTGINDTIEPTKYVWGIIIRVNENISNGKENYFEGLTENEIKDLITYHIDSYVLSLKAPGHADTWLKLAEEYNVI